MINVDEERRPNAMKNIKDKMQSNDGQSNQQMHQLAFSLSFGPNRSIDDDDDDDQ